MLDLDADSLRELEALLPGSVLPGRDGHVYELRDRIGQGGLGWVFRGAWSGMEIAVKVLRPRAASPESLARFDREAEVLRMLSDRGSHNPHLVRFHDYARTVIESPRGHPSWTVPFQVVDLVPEGTLEQAIAASQPYGIGIARTRRVLRHIALAVEDVHAYGVLHRNLKPRNVLLSGTGAREIAQVTDFGLTAVVESSAQAARVGYASPEQLETGHARIEASSDVFALAALFYEMVSGLPAFTFQVSDASPSAVLLRILNDARPAFRRVLENLPRELAARADLVAGLDAALGRALSPEPEERYETVAQLQAAIDPLLAAIELIAALPLPSVRPTARPSTPPPQVSVRVTESPGEVRSLLPDFEDFPASGVPSDRLSIPVGAGGDARRHWSVRSPAVVADGMLSIAVAPSGLAAVGAGPYGLARWDGAAWMRLDAHANLGANIDPTSFRAAAWFEGNAVFAGASSDVVGVGADGVVDMWRFDVPGIVFHGAWADRSGVLLVGERATSGGSVGLIAKMPVRGRAGAQRVRDIVGAGPLRAVTRVGDRVFACGDAGTVVRLDPGGSPRVASVCGPPLFAILAMQDGTAIVVGGGGFVFRVEESLEATLESIQTTRDLFTLTAAEDGSLWCAGGERRVLVRQVARWARKGSLDGAARIRALHVDGARVLAFSDDGAVLEGTRGALGA